MVDSPVTLTNSENGSDNEDAVIVRHESHAATMSDEAPDAVTEGATEGVRISPVRETIKDSRRRIKNLIDSDDDDDAESLTLALDESNEIEKAVEVNERESSQSNVSNNENGTKKEEVPQAMEQVVVEKNLESSNDNNSENAKVELFSTTGDNLDPKADSTSEKSKSNRLLDILDSDLDDDEVFRSLYEKKKDEKFVDNLDSDGSNHLSQMMSKKKFKTKNVKRLVNSETDDDSVVEDEGESLNKDTEKIKHKKAKDESMRGENTRKLLGSDESSSSADEAENLMKKSNKAKKISDLIDSESEDDDIRPTPNGDSPSPSEEELGTVAKFTSKGIQKGKSTKKRTGSIRASKDEAMRQIHSETQKMLRESEISLPYHRPKQRSLQEFLKRRKIVPSLPTGPTTAAKVKMSLQIVGKGLEEKERQAELFYKSSSDSEDEATKSKRSATETFANVEGKQIPTSLSTNIENIGIEETQKLMKNHVQHAHNKKEIIKQGDKDIGVPRKLFDEAGNNSVDREDSSANGEENAEDDKDRMEKKANRKHRESKVGLKDVSVPRILFRDDNDSQMDFESQNADIERKMENKHDEFEDENKAEGQSESIDTLIQSLEDAINDKNENEERMEGSMENDTDDFELKMSEDPFDYTENIKISAVKAISQENNASKHREQENEHISETPFISNKEIAKLNEKNRTLSKSVIETNLNVDRVPDLKKSNFEEQASKTVSTRTAVFDDNSREEVKEVDDSNEVGAPSGHVLGLPLPEFDDEKPTDKSNSIKKRILPNLINIKPMLMGSPDTMIDLSESVKPNRSGVNSLMERFLKHSVSKKSQDAKAEFTVVHAEHDADGLKLVEKVLPYQLSADEKNNDPELSKPGAKLVRLKEELKQKMTTKRNEEWRQKEQELKTLEEDMYTGEMSDCGMEDEEEMDEELSNSGESEPEEDDMPIKEKKPKTKSPFVDAEAEVSDEEGAGDDSHEEDNEDEEINTKDKKGALYGEESEEDDEDNEGDVQESDEENDDDDKSNIDKPKKLKRIVKAFEDDDSNEADIKPLEDETNHCSKSSAFRRTRTDVDIFAAENSNDDWLSDTEADLPAYQPNNQLIDARSQACKTPSILSHSLSFVSPITQLTALNTGLNSVKKDSASKTNYSPQINRFLSIENTPVENKSPGICNSEKRVGLQKKLFDDLPDTPNDEELMDLCSGRFTGIEKDIRGLDKLIGPTTQTSDPDAELLGLCSGVFNTQPANIKELEAGSTKTQNAETQNVRLTLDADAQSHLNTSTKGKPEKKSDTPWTAFTIASSSDEEDIVKALKEEQPKKKNKLKKKVMKLELSDEEESANESLSDMDEAIEEDKDEERFIDYDSEENEVVVIPKKDIKKVAANFLEAEAELSESDWGSADEDEKDLDKLEYEEGDAEDIDEDQMKNQLDKIRMRQVLDDDQREVRLLQEILLEDGELHSDGAGRQRKFKWKNIDKFGADGDADSRPVDEEDISADANDEESELEWRKVRLEREKFLQEQKKENPPTDNIEDDLGDSQIFKLGMKALKKSKNNQSHSQDISMAASKPAMPVMRRTISDLLDSPASGKKPFALLNAMQRGSFLARGEASLARLAVMTKQSSDKAILRPKNSGNFVFAHLSPATKAPVNEDGAAEVQENEDSKEVKFTRKRKPTSDTKPTATKKSKVDGVRGKGKKLF